MSYRSLIKSLPPTLRTLLRQPTYAAGLASVGIHGLLWFVLPLLPLNSSTPTEPEIQRTVSLVELSPAEQSRLPDFSTPQVTLPTIPDPSPDLYSLSPLPNSFSPIPTQPSTPSYPTFPSIPSFLPPPPPFTFPPSYSLPRSPQTSIPPRSPQSPNTTTTSPSPSPSSTPTQTPESQGGATSSLPPNPTPSPSTSPSPQPGERLRQDFATRRQEIRGLLERDPTRSDLNQSPTNIEEWFAAVQPILDGTTQTRSWQNLNITQPYSRDICLTQLANDERYVVVGAVVKNGQVIEDPEPEVVIGSGYRFLNSEAIKAVKSYQFPETPQSKAYLIKVSFQRNHETCPSSVLPSPSPGRNS